MIRTASPNSQLFVPGGPELSAVGPRAGLSLWVGSGRGPGKGRVVALWRKDCQDVYLSDPPARGPAEDGTRKTRIQTGVGRGRTIFEESAVRGPVCMPGLAA